MSVTAEAPAAAGGPRPIYGREPELARLRQALVEAAAPRTPVVVVRGEAGAGRSALLDRFLAGARDAYVLAGRAEILERGIPFGALHHAVTRLADEVPHHLRPLVGRLTSALTRSDVDRAGAATARVIDLALTLFHRLGAHRPVVVAMDDLHLADDATVVALAALARRVAHVPVLFVVSHPVEPAGPDAPVDRFVAQVRANCEVRAVDLGPLAEEDVARLVEAESGCRPGAGSTARVLAASGGNPFLVTQLARTLRVRAGTEAAPDDEAALVELAWPQRAAVIRRLLPPDGPAAALARVLAVAGDVPLTQLTAAGAAAELSEVEAERAFDALVRGRLVTRGPEGGYGFRRDVVRSAVYADLGPAAQRRVHAALADELARLGTRGRHVDPVTIARHAVAATDGPDEITAARAEAAGDERRPSAPDEAARWYARAARLTPPGSPRLAVRRGHEARALIRAGRFAEGIARGQEALAGGLAEPERGRCVSAVATAKVRCGDAGAVDLLDDEIAVGTAYPRLLVDRMLALHGSGRVDEARLVAAQLSRTTPAAHKDRALALVFAALVNADAEPAAAVDRLVADAVRIAPQLQPHVRLFVYGMSASLAARLGRVDRAAELLAAGRPLAGGGDERVDLATTLVEFFRGDWDAALAGTDAHLATAGAAPGLPLLQFVGATIRASRGDFVGARELAGRATVAPPPTLRVVRLGVQGWVELLDQRPAAARATLETAIEPAGGATRRVLAALLATACHRLGDGPAARTALAAAVAAEDGRFGPYAQLQTLLARTEVSADAAAARAAHDVAVATPMPFYGAQAQLLRGQLGDEPEQTLPDAWRAFRRLDAHIWRRRTAEALRSRHLAVPRAGRSRPDDLTELEREIVLLVREGLSNQKIAERLSYSRQSISAYLGRIYTKTHCASRVELVRACAEGALLDEAARQPVVTGA